MSVPANAKPRTFLVKRARAERILSMRAAGATQEQVARALDCSVETIRRTERWAEQNGLLEAAQDRFVRMLNKSAKVYEQRLDDSSQPKLALDAARDIAFGTGVLRRNHADTGAANVEEESLTLILKRRREKLANDPSTAQGSGSGSLDDGAEDLESSEEAPEDFIEGVVTRVVGARADGGDLDPDAEAAGSPANAGA